MATLNETIEQVQNVFNDIEGALQEQGVDTENLKPVDYANAVRGIVNNISVENVNFIPTLIFKYVADNGDKTERPSTPIGGKWNISEVTGNSTFTAPEGWFANIDDYRSVIVSKDILYMSYSIFKNNGIDQYLKWTTPIKISGTNGVDGKQGAQGEPGNIAGIVQTFYTPIYYGAVEESDIPSTPTCNYDVANGVLSILTSGWTKEITTGEDGVIWYQSIATYKSNSSIVGCSVPVRISAAPTDLVEGVNNYYLLTDSLTPPSKDDPDWKLEPPTGFPVPTIDTRYLWTKVITNYTHSYETGPIILVARYQKGLNNIDFDYYCAPSEDELKNLSEDQWFETSQEALVRTETYPGLDETTKYLWCRERFIFDDGVEDHYRIISTYTAAEKAAIIYPGGIFDKRTLYTRTPEQTLYVYYPEGIKLDSDGKINDDGKEYNYFVLKYSYDDVNHKISLNDGEYPSLEEVYALGNWEKMESFDAIYADIGIFKAANVGQFVFDDRYIFSQWGKDKSGNSRKYEEFTEYPTGFENIDKSNVPEDSRRTGIAFAIECGDFIPNILLNAITGEAKFGGGTSVLREDGSGYIADGKIEWKNNGDLLVGDNNGFMAFKDGSLSLSGSVKIGVDAESLSKWYAFTQVKDELITETNNAKSVAIADAESKLAAAKQELEQAITEVEDIANSAKTIAQNASSTAATAKQVSEAADAISKAAQSLANEANANANEAITASNTAQDIANDAKDIADEAQELANSAQNLANTANTNASSAQQEAIEAKQEASEAFTKLSDWASDSTISPFEKQGVKDERAFVVADKNDIDKQVTKYTLSSNDFYTTFVIKHNAYVSDLDDIVNATTESVFIPSNMTIHQAEYYVARTNILETISTVAKAIADEAQNAADAAQDVADKAQKRAEEAVGKINDIAYLTDALGNRGSLTVDGVVMSQIVAVADVEDGEDITDADVNAFLNGSDFARDSDVDPHTEAPCGKLILAAGIPKTTESGDTSLEERAKEAKTRIYEDGCIYSKNLHLKEGCSIGDVSVDGKGIVATYTVGSMNSRIYLNPFFGITSYRESEYGNNYGVRAGGMCDGVALRIGYGPNGQYIDNCVMQEHNAALYVDCDAEGIPAIRIPCGMFSGLRPQVRCITTTGSEEERDLSDYDHTIIVTTESGTETLGVPFHPKEGQRYEIYTIHPEMDLTIDFRGKNTYSITEGRDYNGSNANFTANQRRHIILIYAGGQWWVTYKYLTS